MCPFSPSILIKHLFYKLFKKLKYNLLVASALSGSLFVVLNILKGWLFRKNEFPMQQSESLCKNE